MGGDAQQELVNLEFAYAVMAKNVKTEREALEWAESTFEDITPKTA
jgi:hypothetical protein